MPKRRLSTFAVSTADWMKYRPYKQFTQYDAYYLRLANRVFGELNHPERPARQLLSHGGMVDLAVVLTSWFEDIANEIGIWAAFTRKNKELYGYELPFYDLDDYEPEYINIQDLTYLLWHYIGSASQKLIVPDSQGLQKMAFLLAQLFEEALDDALGTDYYDAYLEVREDIYYFELKGKLSWLAFQNYLVAPEFNSLFGKEMESLMANRDQLEKLSGSLDKVAYLMQDDFLYTKRSAFLALSMPEWLAEIVRCPEPLRADIRQLTRRFSGEFVYEGDKGDFYLYRHCETKRLFEVRQESVTMQGIQQGECVLTQLVKWRSEWWVTGTLMGLGNPEAQAHKKPANPSQISFFAWTDAQQEELRNTEAEMEQSFLEFFGDRLVFFKNNKDLQVAMGQLFEYHNLTRQSGPAKTKLNPQLQKELAENNDRILNGLHATGGLGMFYESGSGAIISQNLPKLVHMMGQKPLPETEYSALLATFLKECSPGLAKYLLGRFGTQNMRFPIPPYRPLEPYLDFMLRHYNPVGFKEVVPSSSFNPEY